MKNLKISLTIILAAIVLTICTGVYAYTGVGEVDPDYTITMPSSLTNGEGTVSGVSGTMEYQFVEITEAKYNSIKKLEAQYELINVYVEYSKNPTDEGLTQSWNSACEKYASQYGNGGDTSQVVTEVLNTYGIGPDILKLCRNAWIVELTDFNASNWKTATGNQIKLDLTTFEGTKYFIGWVKTGSIYDAEVYMAEGTKSDIKQDDDNTNNTNNTNTSGDNNNTNNVNNTNKNTNNSGSTSTNKQDTTASSEGKILPKTGINSIALVLIAIAGTSAGISYKKYRKIK